MKTIFVMAAAALACTATFAQAPAGVTPRPSQETNPTAAGGAPAAKAEIKTDAKKGAMPMGSGAAMGAAGSSHMGMKTMDADGDGMISKKEWDSHHSGMWGRMKATKDMVPISEVEAMMKAGGGSN